MAFFTEDPNRFQDPIPVTSNHSNASTTAFNEYSLAEDVWKIGSPILLGVGTVGNLLSILVLTRRRLRRITTMFYLAVLACADLAVLYTGLLRLWMDNVLGVYIRLQSDVACKVHMFCVYFSLDLSVWILVAVTADRCLYVSAPFSARRWCTLRQARVVVVVVAVVLVVVNMHYFWTVSVIYQGSKSIAGNDYYTCYTSEDPQVAFFVEKIWPWIDFCVVCFIPFIVMVVCNSLIIRQLVVSTRKLRAHSEREFVVKPDGISETQNIPARMDTNKDGQFDTERANETQEAKQNGVAARARLESDGGSVREDSVFSSPPRLSLYTARPGSPNVTVSGGNHVTITGLKPEAVTPKDVRPEDDTNAENQQDKDHQTQSIQSVLVRSKQAEEHVDLKLECLKTLPPEFTSPSASSPHSGLKLERFYHQQQQDDSPQPVKIRHALPGVLPPLRLTASPFLSQQQREMKQSPVETSSSSSASSSSPSQTRTQHYDSHGQNDHVRPSLSSPSPLPNLHEHEEQQQDDQQQRPQQLQQQKQQQQQEKQQLQKEQQRQELQNQQQRQQQQQRLQEQQNKHLQRLSPSQSPNSTTPPQHQQQHNQHHLQPPPPHSPSQLQRQNPVPFSRQASRRSRFTSESLNRHCGIPSVTVMLLTVNTLFWLLTAPIVVFVIGYAYWAPLATERGKAQLSLGWAVVNMLQYANNAVHFFLYCLTGPRFREELYTMCGRSAKRRARVEGSGY